MGLACNLALKDVAEHGFAVVPAVFRQVAVETMRASLEQSLQQQAAGSTIQNEAGSIYAARNILTLWPEAATVWRQPPLPDTLTAILGPRFGLVRVLFFDKPPQNSWALPWHKDLTVAVRDNRLPSRFFSKPTVKAGVPHVEAPLDVLNQMLTLRIHLDDVSGANGPLRVVPGSHRDGKPLVVGKTPPRSILVQQGDVLLIRPLVAHASNRSCPDTQQHRRILHLEFGASPELPDGYSWHTFHPGSPVAQTDRFQGRSSGD